MKNMTLEKIAEITDGQLIYPSGYNNVPIEIQGVVTDNRKIEKDFLFVPIKGARVDGHDFINGIYALGAAASLSEVTLNDPVGPYILVKSSLLALKQIAAYYRTTLNIPIIGVIGSVGKTSTKEMLSCVLSTKFSILKTEGNLNNEIGLPLTICRINSSHEAAVVEMGISEFGEMDRLGQIAKPDYIVFTNVGTCHLENLIDRDGILKAKSEVFSHMSSNGVAILNGDDDKLLIADTQGIRKIYFGFDNQEYWASDIFANDISSTHALIHTKHFDLEVNIPLPGKHNVYNALAATALGVELGLSKEEIKKGLETAKTISGRNNIIHRNGITIIDDCYNANPVSMKSSIDVLNIANGRKIAVLGDMGELGADEAALHASIGQYINSKNIDYIYACGELSKNLINSLNEDYKKKAFYYSKLDDLIKDLKSNIKANDTVLVKASHFMGFSKIIEQL